MNIHLSRFFWLLILLSGFLLFSAEECKDRSSSDPPKTDQDTVVYPEKATPPEGYEEPKEDSSTVTPSNDPDCMGEPIKGESLPCPDVFDPVCGCNGVNYPNPCSAMRAGVKKWEKGRCD